MDIPLFSPGMPLYLVPPIKKKGPWNGHWFVAQDHIYRMGSNGSIITMKQHHGTVDKHKGGLTTIFLNILKVIPPI